MNIPDLMAELAACWCDALSSTIGGSPAQCCLVSGAPAIVDCCAGYGWVRLVSAYPSAVFPAPATTVQPCPANAWALRVEVGVTRCAPQPCEVLGNVCCDNEADAAAILYDDLRAAQGLFSCDSCLPLTSRDIVAGAITLYGPEGGCNGIKATAILRSAP